MVENPDLRPGATLAALAAIERFQLFISTTFDELIHDLLAGVVEKSRTARQERFEKEEAARLAEAERKAKEKAEKETRTTRRRARTVVITVSAALALAVIVAIIGFVQYGKAVAAKRKAVAAKHDAQEASRRATAALEEAKRAKFAADQAAERATSALAQVKKEKSAAEDLIRFMQYDLRDTLGKLGHLEMMKAINGRIMKYYEDHSPEAGDVDALRERGTALVAQGNLFLAQGDLASALKSYRDSLDIADKLAKQDPSNARWQRDLSLSYEDVGDVLKAQGNLDGALKSYRDDLAIAEKLAKQDPSNAEWQRDLSVVVNGTKGPIPPAMLGDHPSTLPSSPLSTSVLASLQSHVDVHRFIDLEDESTRVFHPPRDIGHRKFCPRRQRIGLRLQADRDGHLVIATMNPQHAMHVDF
jgi:tetratricopeptide (TPR) repeat protein